MPVMEPGWRTASDLHRFTIGPAMRLHTRGVSWADAEGAVPIGIRFRWETLPAATSARRGTGQPIDTSFRVN